MAPRISGIVPFLLITLVCVGGVEVFYFVLERVLLSPGKQLTTVVHQQPAKKVKTVDVVPKSAPDVDHSIILKRNLFGPPPEKKIEQTGAQVEELEATTLELVLMGTIHGLDDENRAIILTKKDRKQEIYRAGDQIQGAVVKEIRRGTIVLTVDGQDESLDMSESGKYGPRVATGPVAVTQQKTRRSVALPLPNGQPASGMQQSSQVKPRVVRPTRKIVSSQRRVPSAQDETAESPDELPDGEEEAVEEQE